MLQRDVFGNLIDPALTVNKVDDPEWGLVADKPVFVGKMADRLYLSHIRDDNNNQISWNRMGSISSNTLGFDGPTDAWKGLGVDGREYQIYINWYGNEVPSVAPKGLAFV